jgi:two-component system OmpR family response regulator
VIHALVVDDHESVRVLVGKVLQMHGWDVHAAASGSAALAHAVDAGVDVLVTDISLGDMSGLRLAEEVRGMQPAVRVLLMSGHLPEELVRLAHVEHVPGPGEAGQRVLSKPFGVADIRAAADALVADGECPAGRAGA